MTLNVIARAVLEAQCIIQDHALGSRWCCVDVRRKTGTPTPLQHDLALIPRYSDFSDSKTLLELMIALVRYSMLNYLPRYLVL